MEVKPLWEHQRLAIERAAEVDEFAFLFEPGTGKTRTTIETFLRKYKKHGRVLRTLIMAPQVVTFNWKREFDMYAKDIHQSRIVVLHGTGDERLKQLERTPNYSIVICNYETLLMDRVFTALKTFDPEIVVADESHRIKNPTAQRTKRCIALSTLSTYRYILSGTPVLQNSMDLFAQFLFLDKGKTFGSNFFLFRAKYFADGNAELRKRTKFVTWPKWIPKREREEELTALVASKALAVKKSECLDLPPYVRQTIYVDMTDQQRRAYKEMKEDYITFINSKAFTAQLAITKALRLQQIVSGFVMSEDGETTVFKNTPREKALLDLLEDITPDHKMIVWACWRSNHGTIRELLAKASIEFRELLGDQSALVREKSIQDFRTDPGVRVLVSSQGAGGIGINLVEAPYAVYYSRNFSLEHDLQSEARNNRGGSEIHDKITRIDLVTKGTIDEEGLKALAEKQDVAERLLAGSLI